MTRLGGSKGAVSNRVQVLMVLNKYSQRTCTIVKLSSCQGRLFIGRSRCQLPATRITTTKSSSGVRCCCCWCDVEARTPILIRTSVLKGLAYEEDETRYH
jgi:hypothetical protein